MREDIDIRLLDYFYFGHSAVDKSHSLVVIEEETERDSPRAKEIPAADSDGKH